MWQFDAAIVEFSIASVVVLQERAGKENKAASPDTLWGGYEQALALVVVNCPSMRLDAWDKLSRISGPMSTVKEMRFT